MAENIELTVQERTENELLNDAIAYAATMHRSGLRKGTTMPYIVLMRLLKMFMQDLAMISVL